MKRAFGITVFVFLSAWAASARAQLVFTDLGTAAPPGSLGAHAVTPFPLDTRELLVFESGVTEPACGTVGFTPNLQHRRVPDTWTNWSHGAQPDVYFSGLGVNAVTLAMPPGTKAFYFYAAPNLGQVFDMTATTQDGTTSNALPVDGLAARGFGFHSNGTDNIVSIDVSCDGCGGFGFAVGEFAIACGTSGPTQVDIDIKPGSDPNSINCNPMEGTISVAILTTADFNALDVDHTTVTLEGAVETHVDRNSYEPRRHEEDVDGDGDTDLVLHFVAAETTLDCSSVEATLTGETFGGAAIEGTDSVNMVPLN